MVYTKSWSDFESAATDLYAKAPTKVRYCVRFARTTGQLVLKLTDDTTCIKYKTHSSIILNRFESLNLRLLSQISNMKPRARLPLPTSTGRSGTPGVGIKDEEEEMNGPGPKMAGGERAGTPGLEGGKSAGTPGGGGKKKKKGKR